MEVFFAVGEEGFDVVGAVDLPELAVVVALVDGGLEFGEGGADEGVVAGGDDEDGAVDQRDQAGGGDGLEVGLAEALGVGNGAADEGGAGHAHQVGVGEDGGGVVGEGAFDDDGGEVVAQLGGGDGDGGAEADAEENQLLGLVGALVAELVDDLGEVVAIPEAGGDVEAGAVAVGAQVDRQDVVA